MIGERKVENQRKKIRLNLAVFLRSFAVFSLSVFLFAACSEIEKPKTEPFYAQTAPPQRKEFRWSNGKMPESFDPATASAAPETDISRAVYEGLTEIDPKTLTATPAIATDWKASEDFKTWTFNLRKNARWSNGERVTAQDFVRSWTRLKDLGDKVSHRELLQNIVGINTPNATENIILPSPLSNSNVAVKPSPTQTPANSLSNSNSAIPTASPSLNLLTNQKLNIVRAIEPAFGVTAKDNYTLEVSLVNADKDFAALVAHPLFRPIYGDGKNFETNKLSADIVTNGAFRIASIGADGITLDRAENYWNKDAVELERVRLVPTENAEKALAAYRAGEIDAVTNADFEPLALKLLTPYEDFRRTAFSAINLYEFNRNKPPFDDRRVREALAISIERERLTGDEMDGASLPALTFSPLEKPDENKLIEDTQKAKTLLSESGFPNGENFPKVKLLVNRNNLQQRVARNVARMWKRNLNVETEIVIAGTDNSAIQNGGDYDLIRRGVVLPTADETINMMAIFAAPTHPNTINQPTAQPPLLPGENLNQESSVLNSENPLAETAIIDENAVVETLDGDAILTDEQALGELPAIPLYFPTSYSLVKPYVQGFEVNVLNAPSLKDVRINNEWQPKKTSGE